MTGAPHLPAGCVSASLCVMTHYLFDVHQNKNSNMLCYPRTLRSHEEHKLRLTWKVLNDLRLQYMQGRVTSEFHEVLFESI